MTDTKTEMMLEGRLTPKQAAFVRHYQACGNGVQAAKLAGYGGQASTLSARVNKLLKHKWIKASLQEADRPAKEAAIMDRDERWLFWSTVVRDKGEKMIFRLRASELLARAQGDFLSPDTGQTFFHEDKRKDLVALLERPDLAASIVALTSQITRGVPELPPDFSEI